MHNFVERIQRVFPGERSLSYGCFIQNAAEREDVRTVIDLGCPALRLLWRHVTEGAQDQAGHGVLIEDRGSGFV